MAAPWSSLVSFASRFHPLRSAHQALRRLHATKISPVTPEQNFDPRDQNSDVTSTKYILDIECDDTLQHEDFFNVKNLFTVKQLFDARVHYGHKDTALDERMKQFLFGIRANQVIFDLDITAYHLRAALNIAAHIAMRGGIIMFVARSPQNCYYIEETALACKEFAHTRRWLGGELTNSDSVYNGVTRLPDLFIFLSTLSEVGRQHPAVTEAAKMLIPTIGIVDSNCNPNQITYPVPGNDDTPVAVQLYCDLFKSAILLGKEERARRFSQLQEQTEVEKRHPSPLTST